MVKTHKIEEKLDSREVAEMINKEHKDLLRDIRRYNKQMTERKIAPSDFFEESEYKDNTGRLLPCYKVTKKGCEFIAHKLTGVKGTEFTAKYINRFHEMQGIIEAENSRKEITALQKEVREQQKILRNIVNRLEVGMFKGAISTSKNQAYISEIIKTIQDSSDTEYLMGVYSFAISYPDKSKCMV